MTAKPTARSISIENITRFDRLLRHQNFYGVLEIHYENGAPCRLKKNHSIEEDELIRLMKQ